MYNHDDELDGDEKRRVTKTSRLRAPQASRTRKPRRKTTTHFPGSHQRRNKHWSW